MDLKKIAVFFGAIALILVILGAAALALGVNKSQQEIGFELLIGIAGGVGFYGTEHLFAKQ